MNTQVNYRIQRYVTAVSGWAYLGEVYLGVTGDHLPGAVFAGCMAVVCAGWINVLLRKEGDLR